MLGRSKYLCMYTAKATSQMYLTINISDKLLLIYRQYYTSHTQENMPPILLDIHENYNKSIGFFYCIFHKCIQTQNNAN